MDWLGSGLWLAGGAQVAAVLGLFGASAFQILFGSMLARTLLERPLKGIVLAMLCASFATAAWWLVEVTVLSSAEN